MEYGEDLRVPDRIGCVEGWAFYAMREQVMVRSTANLFFILLQY
jgi:hypothetical protein